MPLPAPVLDAAALQSLLGDSFPGGEVPEVSAVTDDGVVVRVRLNERHGRPGGTASGPTVMTLADTAAWLAILSRVGPELMAVTSSLHIDFLRKPSLSQLEATGALLKLGRRLAVVAVTIRGDGGEVVAQAQVTYARATT